MLPVDFKLMYCEHSTGIKWLYFSSLNARPPPTMYRIDRMESRVHIAILRMLGKAMGEALSSKTRRDRQVRSLGDPLIKLLTYFSRTLIRSGQPAEYTV
jgi:hypothetical protein